MNIILTRPFPSVLCPSSSRHVILRLVRFKYLLTLLKNESFIRRRTENRWTKNGTNGEGTGTDGERTENRRRTLKTWDVYCILFLYFIKLSVNLNKFVSIAQDFLNRKLFLVNRNFFLYKKCILINTWNESKIFVKLEQFSNHILIVLYF